jgi:hypothetical protein
LFFFVVRRLASADPEKAFLTSGGAGGNSSDAYSAGGGTGTAIVQLGAVGTADQLYSLSMPRSIRSSES